MRDFIQRVDAVNVSDFNWDEDLTADEFNQGSEYMVGRLWEKVQTEATDN